MMTLTNYKKEKKEEIAFYDRMIELIDSMPVEHGVRSLDGEMLGLFDGEATAKLVYGHKETNIVVAKFKAGAKTKKHNHGVKEIMVVVTGEMKLRFYSGSGLSEESFVGETICKQFESVEIPSKLVHVAIFDVDTKLIVIEVPSDTHD